ncbi:hypothetical protein NMY22_g5685 [Coprinellus aureogranulatus]|nr:hypothetical protein NMY22_g5685 [Coprinellus aureogranulatus]
MSASDDGRQGAADRAETSGRQDPQAQGTSSSPQVIQHYYGTVNNVGQADNCNFGVNHGLITSSTTASPPGASVTENAKGEPSTITVHRHPNGKIDLLSLLNPILDASHTRNLRTSPPNSVCFPGTRQDVIQDVQTWVNSSLKKGHILWIYGFGGCGKSAIAREVARHFDDKGQLAAAFFFFRGAGDRSGTSRFATTIASQMARAIPATTSYIKAALKKDPGLRLSTTSLTVQFDGLVYGPIKATGWDRLVASLRKKPFLIVLDGLDECEDRVEIATFIQHMIQFFSDNPRIPLRFIIASRVENHIHQRLHSSSQVLLLNLVDRTSDSDIAAALDFAIANEKPSRLLNCDRSWPSADDKAKLVKHIGGSFIFMTTIVKYLFDPDSKDGLTPMDRLPIVLSTEANFDDLYRAIFGRCQHLAHFQEITSTIALALTPLSVLQIGEILELQTVDVLNVLLTLHAVMQIPGDDQTPVTLWHTSLRDFLCTEGRSGMLYASPAHQRRIAYHCISSAASPTGSPGSLPVEYSRRFAMEHWLAFVQSIGDGAGMFGAEMSSFIDHLKLHFPESYNTILRIYFKLLPGQPTGTTVLELLARCRRWTDLESIAKPKVNINLKLVQPTVKDELTRRVLEEACHSENWKLVRNLISNNPHTVNIRFKDIQGDNLVTALHAACHHKEFEVIHFLLDNGADPNISGISAEFRAGTPLNFASYNGDIKLITRLFECGADPNFQGGYYGSALQAACYLGKLEALNLLLDHNADPNLEGGCVVPALLLSAINGDVDCAQALLEHKADPNMRDINGDTPLHKACWCGQTKVAELLLDFGVDPTIRNNDGETALQRAMRHKGGSEIVRMLHRRGVTK